MTKTGIGCRVLCLALFACQSPVESEPRAASGPDKVQRARAPLDAVEEEPRWISLSSDVPAEPQIEVAGDELILRLPGYFAATQIVDGETYVRIAVPGHEPLARAQFPELPKVRLNVPIAPGSSPELAIVSADFADQRSEPVLPSRGDITRDKDPATVPYVAGPFYGSDGRYPESEAALGTPFVLRDLSGVAVQFQPFVYFPAERTLRVYSEIRVRLSNAGAETIVLPRSDAFSSVYASAFAHYLDTAILPGDIAEPGRLVIITADAYVAALEPLRAWKVRRGLVTEIKKLSEVGTSADAIAAFIKKEYESPRSLTYVILVGEGDQVPTLEGGYEGAHCDACYAMVAGDDYYPDLFISRISARDVKDVETQVAKFIAYERDPDASGAWYKRAIGVASNEGSPTDWERAEWLRESLEGYGFSAAKLYDPGATADSLIDEINAGASLINYLGHGSGTYWVTTGFSTDDVESLHNGWKLPFVIDVSCMNGSWVDIDSSLAEAMLRAGSASAPAGAIAMYSASTNAAWVPPTHMQSWAVQELLVKEKKSSIGSLYFGGAARVLELYTDGQGQMLVEQYNIFGDASLVVRTQAPRALAVSHPSAIPASGSFEVSVTSPDGAPASGATVVLSARDVIASAHTDATGVARLTTSGLTGEIDLTVTAFNAVPHQARLSVR